jgi:hypothetical protein
MSRRFFAIAASLELAMNPFSPMLHAHEGLRGRQWILLPREHGAWGLLLQPFFASAVLVNQWGFERLSLP